MATDTRTESTAEEPDERVAGLVEAVTLAGEGHEQLSVAAPFTGEHVGTIPQAERADVEHAVERAHEAQERWAETPVDERAAVMLRLHDLVLDRKDELMDVMQLEAGKARKDAHEAILDLPTTSRFYAHRAEEWLSRDRPRGAFPVVTRTEVNHHPVGVVGFITPWNYPLVLTLSESVPALLSGNAVVVNPAEQTPFTAMKAKRLLVEAGLPPDCFQVVTGDGEPIADPLIEAVDYFSFTGSTKVGREVGATAARHLTDFSLELGGKNAAIVLPDADLDRTVRGLLQGCFASAGQLCISFERLYVHEDVHDEFLERFVAATADLELGTAYSFEVDVGSLISERQLEKVRDHVEDAVEKGATVETGGEHRPDVGPYFFEPTVLTGVPDDAMAKDLETFGPVTRVEPVADVEEAVRKANDTDYGLNGSVWTGDAARGRAVARRIEAGTVGVNDAYIAAWGSVGAPMGGMKDSGVGRRHGEEGFFKYTGSQTVATQRFVPTGPREGESFEDWAGNIQLLLRLFKSVPGLR
jgi:succinate-semialdehyde dehydrogenase/glutarate-semialdehyde dehydrogenase